MIRPGLWLFIIAFLLSGCASALMADRETDRLFREGRYDEAAVRLQAGLEKEGDGRDQLLYLCDLGLALHSAGKYQESIKYLLLADKIAEIKDYTSLATEGATLLTTDNIKQYKGEDFEKVLINTYLAMNYAMLGDRENALVEARRVNHKLQLMVTDGQRKYKQNAFARYLSATLYEADGDYNDAYVDYKLVHDLQPDYPGLGRDLWRVARLNDDMDGADDWKREYKLGPADVQAALMAMPRSGKGEIIILYENGISPIKKPNPSFRELPKFFPRPNPVRWAEVQVDGHDAGPTHVLHDIEATAIENLDEKYGGLIAKKLAGIVAKEVVADQVGKATKSNLVGFLTKVALYASDQADVRSWSLLPRDLQVARVVVDPGMHQVELLPNGVRPSLPVRAIQVSPGKKVFLDFRYTP